MLIVDYVIFAAVLVLWAYLIRRTFVLATAISGDQDEDEFERTL